MASFLLAIDQGTTSSRAIVFTRDAEPVSQHQIELTTYYPKPGWVEQDSEEMWLHILTCCRQALQKIHITARDIAAVGITNQRETIIIWDKNTGQAIYPAIVWQDRRTHEYCREMTTHPIYSRLPAKTGLLLDPYFSASKIVWLLESIPGARERAVRGELLVGTVDTFLLWRLTKGKIHATDATNASRTLLFNIRTQEWDSDILTAMDIPAGMLPRVLDSSADFGAVDAEFFGTSIPIASVIGDQQAATVGQACFQPGMMKATFGTGCFMLLNTGTQLIQSTHQLLSTIAYRIQGKVTYGLEGSIFSAGVTVKWLRDKLHLIHTAAETETLAQSVQDTKGVYFVPAFTGLGAPYWDPHARAAVFGITGDCGGAEIARAALEAVAYQTRDLLTAMHNDSQTRLTTLRVDGGMAANHWLLQFVADILNIHIQRPHCIETTALGAAFLAGLQVGWYSSLEEISELWQADKTYVPQMEISERESLYRGWENVIKKVMSCRFN